jgi:predicted PurR-regulated permease PerM
MTEILKKHWRLIVSLGIVIVILALFWAWRGALLPFIIGLVLAYLMLPGIKWLESRLPPKGKWQKPKRIFSILLVFFVTLGVVGVLLSFIIITVIQTFTELFSRSPEYITNILDWIQEWAEGFQAQLPPALQTQVQQFITNLGLQMESILQNIAQRGFSMISGTFGALLGFAALPLFLFYLLKDHEKIRRNIYAFLPSWAEEHTRNIVIIIEKVLGRYIRATLVLGGIVAVMSFIGLTILGVPYAPALAFLAGVTEMIPTIGPWIGGGVAVLVTLSVAPEKVFLVAALFVGVQLIENNLLVPRIQGGFLRVHPAAVLLLLVLGAYIAGIWGIILSVPIAATVARIVEYIRARNSLVKLSQPEGATSPDPAQPDQV